MEFALDAAAERPPPLGKLVNGAGRKWQILLIGGASGVGKTRLSYSLARHYGINLTEIDDFQVVLETLTTPLQQPLLHFWRTHPEEFMAWGDEARLDYFVRVCREVFQPALEAVIANRLDSGLPAILEGDFLLPEFATQTQFGDQPNEGRVRALFVTEADEAQIAANYRAREGNEQPIRAHAEWVKNRWLTTECARLGVPSLCAHPWDTVLPRAIAALSGNSPR